MPYGNDAARLRALKANFGTDRATGAPATLYVALLRQASGPGTTLGTEPTGDGAYARVAIANTDSTWTFGAASLGNTSEIRWPTATGLYSITAALNQWALYDASSGGTCLAFGELTSTITVTGSGDTPVISASNLQITQG